MWQALPVEDLTMTLMRRRTESKLKTSNNSNLKQRQNIFLTTLLFQIPEQLQIYQLKLLTWQIRYYRIWN